MLSAKCRLLFGISLIAQHKERQLYHVHMVTSRLGMIGAFSCILINVRPKATLPPFIHLNSVASLLIYYM